MNGIGVRSSGNALGYRKKRIPLWVLWQYRVCGDGRRVRKKVGKRACAMTDSL